MAKKVNKKKKVKKKKVAWKPERGKPSRFPKGVSGNPNGRPKGTKNKYSIAELWDAIRIVENKKGRKKLLVAFVEEAYDNPQIMVALMKKLLPDLKAIEGIVATTEMSDELAADIQRKIKDRWMRK